MRKIVITAMVDEKTLAEFLPDAQPEPEFTACCSYTQAIPAILCKLLASATATYLGQEVLFPERFAVEVLDIEQVGQRELPLAVASGQAG